MCVHVWKRHFSVDWRLLVEERFFKNCIPMNVFGFHPPQTKIGFWRPISGFWSLQTCLLCIVLAGAGSVAMANGVSNRWQMTCDTWHKTCDTWNMTFSSSFPFCLFLPFFALLPISANIDKFSDSCMRDFYLLILLYLSTELAASVRLRKKLVWCVSSTQEVLLFPRLTIIFR